MAIARANWRDVRPNDSRALRAALGRNRLLRFDDPFPDFEFRRDLDRALCAEPARDSGERDHLAKHGANDSVGGVSGPWGTGRTGERLRLGRQSSWNTGRYCLRFIFDRESA